jgi:hypothetical protein
VNASGVVVFDEDRGSGEEDVTRYAPGILPDTLSAPHNSESDCIHTASVWMSSKCPLKEGMEIVSTWKQLSSVNN